MSVHRDLVIKCLQLIFLQCVKIGRLNINQWVWWGRHLHGRVRGRRRESEWSINLIIIGNLLLLMPRYKCLEHEVDGRWKVKIKSACGTPKRNSHNYNDCPAIGWLLFFILLLLSFSLLLSWAEDAFYGRQFPPLPSVSLTHLYQPIRSGEWREEERALAAITKLILWENSSWMEVWPHFIACRAFVATTAVEMQII